MALLEVCQHPRNRIETLEGLPVSFVCGKSLCSLTGCRCHTTASQGHATSCVSRSRSCWLHGVLVAMVPKGSQVDCVLHQLFNGALPGAARPSRSQHPLVVGLLHDFPHVHLRFHWSIQLALVSSRFLG